MTDFEGVLHALAAQQVEFILIGGMAAIVHGSTRVTEDLDIVYRRTPDNLQRLVAAIEPQKPYLRGVPPGLPFDWSPATLRMGLNFTLTTRLGDLDLLGEIPGGNYEELIDHTIEIELFGVTCRCLDSPTLIRVKRAAGRPKDLETAAELQAFARARQPRGT